MSQSPARPLWANTLFWVQGAGDWSKQPVEAEIGDNVLRDLDGDRETRHRFAFAGEKIVGTAFKAPARGRNITDI
jgi:hypothetical protein